MKRILVLILIQLIYVQSAFAISLSELQSNSNKYAKYEENQSSTIYVNIDSIKPLRYSPPYHTLQAKIYFVSYASDSIIETSNTYNYNYDQSINSLITKALQLHPTYSDEKITNWVLKEVEKNSGITIGNTNINCYNLKGKYIGAGKPSFTEKVEFMTNEYLIANFIFKKHYAMKFI